MGVLEKFQNKARLNQKAGIFLSCFILSVIFWFFTSLSRNTETYISIPVSYKNIPLTSKIEGALPAKLDYHFRGTGFELMRVHLRKRPDSIEVDVSKAMNDKQQLRLNTISLRSQFPGDKLASKVFPETISHGFKAMTSKKVPVVFNYNISYRKRFGASGNVIFKPDSLEIAGPPEDLIKIKNVVTNNVSLHDVASHKSGGIGISTVFPKEVMPSTKNIYYYFPVEEYTEGSLEIPVEMPVSQRNRVTLLPRTVKVTFMASLKNYSMIGAEDFQATANIPTGSRPAQLAVSLRRFPKGIRQIRIEPEVVNYVIYE